MQEYDLIADWYASERVGLAGVPELLALVKALPLHARVLDIGCGNGLPLTKALVAAGVHAIGADSAAKMLGRFRSNLPVTPVVRALAQALPFGAATFDGVVAWGVVFHLPPPEEIKVIEGVARVLKPGGLFLFTAGYPTDADEDRDGQIGHMNGVEFRYYSFTQDGYRRVLEDHDLSLIDFHTDEGQNGYYLATKDKVAPHR